MKRLLIYSVSLVVLLVLAGCESQSSGANYETYSNDSLQKLEPIKQYEVVSKLYTSLYKAKPAKEFFEIGWQEVKNKNTYTELQTALNTPLKANAREVYLSNVLSEYNYDNTLKPRQVPMAILYELPLSKDYFDFYMAYVLANTILFSPAYELDSVKASDIHRVLSRLEQMMHDGNSIADIAYAHMTSQENWRRFRSPEDNTREMMEIFLHRFIDAEVPLAAQACKNWYLNGDFELIIDYNENSTAQNIMGTSVTTCDDFYRAVVNHSDFLPTVYARVVEYYFADASQKTIDDFVAYLKGKNITHFDDLFKAILFSEAYLLDNARPLRAEEAILSTAHSVDFKPSQQFFRYLNRNKDTHSTLSGMNQASMTYKLGRIKEVPTDSLSFAHLHRAVREYVLLEKQSWLAGAWSIDFIDNVSTSDTQLIRYVFVALLKREPSDDEMQTLQPIIGEETNKENRAKIVMDYISRLAELYYMRAIS